jgi:hypothetical protein
MSSKAVGWGALGRSVDGWGAAGGGVMGSGAVGNGVTGEGVAVVEVAVGSGRRKGAAGPVDAAPGVGGG